MLSHLIWHLSWCRKKGSENDKKSLHCHTTPSVMSRSPFWLWLRSLENLSFLTSSRRIKIVNDVGSIWDRCGPSPLWHGPKTSEPAHSGKKSARPFLPSLYCCGSNRAFFPNPLWRPSRRGVMHTERAARWVRTWSYSRSPNLSLNSIGNRSPRWQTVPQAGPKQSSPLVIVPSEAVMGSYAREKIRWPWDWISGRGKQH